MPTRNVYLTAALDSAVQERVDSGAYESVSEVVRTALRALERVEKEDRIRLEAFERLLTEGDRSPDFIGDPFEAVYAEVDWRPPAQVRTPTSKKRKTKRGG